jgi:ATP-dependent Clp protease protease subunit
MSKKIYFRAGPIMPARFWNVAEVNGDTAEMTLYGDVVPEQPIDWWTMEPLPGQYICPEAFAQDLALIKNKRVINIKINSLGGDVYTALAIHNALKELPGTKNIIVEGIAASAASVIAMAGDTVKMYPGSLMMIHGVSAFVYDYMQINDLKKMIKAMDASERAIAAIYAGKTGTEETTLRAMMERETWMTGKEAIEKGFADELLEGEGPQMAMTVAEHLLIVNGVKHNTEGLTIPERFNIPKLAAAAPAPVVNKNNSEKGEQKQMTIEELRAQYPEFVAQIEQEAVAADRARIREIEEIQDTIGDAEMIAAAKFTNPTNAAALALAAMKKHKALGTDFLAARAQETQPAAAVPAAAAPEDNPAAIAAKQKEEETQEINKVAELYGKIFK